MKIKLTTLLLTLSLLFSLCPSTSALAADTGKMDINSDSKITYEIIDVKILNSSEKANYRDVEITVVYQEILVPPATVPYTTYENGLKYSGTLSLYAYSQDSEKTLAYYRGRVYVVNI